MLAIKFRREGKKGQPSFRLVVVEKRSKIDGRYVADIGWFSPISKKFNVVAEKARYWIGVGAKPTDTVFNLLVRAGVLPGPKKAVHRVKRNVNVKEETASSASPDLPEAAEAAAGSQV